MKVSMLRGSSPPRRWSGRSTTWSSPYVPDAPRIRGLGDVSTELPMLQIGNQILVSTLAAQGDSAQLRINTWYQTMADLVKRRAATCDQIRRFNAASLAVYDAHVKVFSAVTGAGVDVPPPGAPPLIARSVSTGTHVSQIFVDDGCDGSSPDYDGGVRAFPGWTVASQGSSSPGLGAAVAPVAVLYIGEVITYAVIAVATILILRALRRALTSEVADEARVEYAKIEKSRDPERVKMFLGCVETGADARTCFEEVRRALPPGVPPEGSTLLGGLGGLLKLGILGGLAVVVLPRILDRR